VPGAPARGGGLPRTRTRGRGAGALRTREATWLPVEFRAEHHFTRSLRYCSGAALRMPRPSREGEKTARRLSSKRNAIFPRARIAAAGETGSRGEAVPVGGQSPLSHAGWRRTVPLGPALTSSPVPRMRRKPGARLERDPESEAARAIAAHLSRLARKSAVPSANTSTGRKLVNPINGGLRVNLWDQPRHAFSVLCAGRFRPYAPPGGCSNDLLAVPQSLVESALPGMLGLVGVFFAMAGRRVCRGRSRVGPLKST